jgi:hypothetical protein
MIKRVTIDGHMPQRRDYLKRLPAAYYRGNAYVHWILTIEGRKTGWLIPTFYYKFREILTHATFRYGFCCPIYCCMPDHFHLLWIGISASCDQRLGMRYFRKQLNSVLAKLDTLLQLQPYDHVLREEQRERGAFEAAAEYIARNPERRGLVPQDGYATYRYTDCLMPGCPELKLFDSGYWDRMWRVYSHLRAHGLCKSAQVGESSMGSLKFS